MYRLYGYGIYGYEHITSSFNLEDIVDNLDRRNYTRHTIIGNEGNGDYVYGILLNDEDYIEFRNNIKGQAKTLK